MPWPVCRITSRGPEGPLNLKHPTINSNLKALIPLEMGFESHRFRCAGKAMAAGPIVLQWAPWATGISSSSSSSVALVTVYLTRSAMPGGTRSAEPRSQGEIRSVINGMPETKAARDHVARAPGRVRGHRLAVTVPRPRPGSGTGIKFRLAFRLQA